MQKEKHVQRAIFQFRLICFLQAPFAFGCFRLVVSNGVFRCPEAVTSEPKSAGDCNYTEVSILETFLKLYVATKLK